MLTNQPALSLRIFARHKALWKPFYTVSRSVSNKESNDVSELLRKPSWSVRSLLPTSSQTSAPEITSKELHHLLRLSALPLPGSAEEEAKLLNTLQAQLHFVREIQQVDTSSVTPLRAIRDETTAAQEQQTLTTEALKEALSKEEIVGKHYKRIQRRVNSPNAKDAGEDWAPLAHTERKAGNYFIAENEKS